MIIKHKDFLHDYTQKMCDLENIHGDISDYAYEIECDKETQIKILESSNLSEQINGYLHGRSIRNIVCDTEHYIHIICYVFPDESVLYTVCCFVKDMLSTETAYNIDPPAMHEEIMQKIKELQNHK